MDVQTSGGPTRWSNAQAYGLSVICLIMGALLGYLFHAPAAPPVQSAATTQAGPSGMNGITKEQMGKMAQQITPEQLKSMVDKAVQPLLDQLQKSPNDPVLLTQVASEYMKGHEFDTSEEYLERAAKAKPTPDAYTNLASCYHYAGSEDKAFETLDKALALDPNFANALFNLGMLQLQVKGHK